MLKNIEILNEKFLKIKNSGWIKSLKQGTTGIGYTFEHLIGKAEDNFFLPDFNGIEIKTKHHFSKGYLTLFNLTPDGEYLFPIEYIRKNYGYPDKVIKKQNVFNYSINNSEKCILKDNLFKLHVDYKNEKVFLEIQNITTKNIDHNISWSFKSIEERIFTKLSYIVLVKATSKYINGIEHFHYYDIKFYKFKGMDTFLKLLENGKIRITFKIGVFRNGQRINQVHDHGTGFDININDFPLLFELINF